MPVLSGENVILRPYRKSDLPHILSWTNDSETIRNLSERFVYPYTEANGETFLNSRLTGDPNVPSFVIARRDNEEYLGQIDLGVNWLYRRGEMGIVIGQAEDRCKGYGREAIRLLLHYAFRTLGLNRVSLTVLNSNEPARRCYLSCGFIIEGIRREDCYVDGAFVDVMMMSILRREYEATQDNRCLEHPHD